MDNNWLILPKKITPEKEIWEQAGFQFLEIKNNYSSWKVKLPKGWTLEPIIKSLIDNIIDESGMIRGQIFYEHLFNHLQNYMVLLSRYSIHIKRISDDNSIEIIYFGNETEKLYVAGQINRTKMATREDRLKVLEEEQALLKDATNWANANYPEWENINAYWDIPINENNKVKTKNNTIK